MRIAWERLIPRVRAALGLTPARARAVENRKVLLIISDDLPFNSGAKTRRRSSAASAAWPSE